MDDLRSRLIAEIDRERASQDAQWGGSLCDDRHTPAEWIALLTRQMGLAVDDAAPTATSDRWRRQLLRCAALALAALEAHDRRFPPERVAGPPEGSLGSGW